MMMPTSGFVDSFISVSGSPFVPSCSFTSDQLEQIADLPVSLDGMPK